MTGRRRGGGSHRPSSGGHTPTRRPDTGGSDPSRSGTSTGGGRGVGADLDALDTMAGRLDATRGKVEGVGNTVRGINVGRESMGIVGSGFTGAAQAHLRTAEQHVARTTRAVEAAQRGTRGTATAYRTQDSTGATNLAGIDTTTHPPATTPQSAPTHQSTGQGGTPSSPPSISDVLDGKAKNPVGGSVPSSTSTPPPRTPARPPRMSNDDFMNLPPHRQIEVAEAEVSQGARTFRDNDEAIRYGADNWNDYVDGLPAEQKQSLYNYTTDPPHEPSYVDINGHLRDPVNGPDSPEIRRDIENIDRAMAGNPVPEDIVVSRGTNLHHIPMPAPEMEGKTFHDPAYMSTSLGDTAGAFEGKDAVLHLRVPEGTPALYMENVSAFGNGERELLLGRDMSYRVDRVVWENGQWQIYGEIIPPK